MTGDVGSLIGLSPSLDVVALALAGVLKGLSCFAIFGQYEDVEWRRMIGWMILGVMIRMDVCQQLKRYERE